MSIDIEALRKIAQATPTSLHGAWAVSVKQWGGDDIRTIVHAASDTQLVQEPTTYYSYPSGSWIEADGDERLLAHIAAFSPAVCLQLLDEIERLSAEPSVESPAPEQR